jgi:NADH:ubiquinone oxidoreductase subunit H
MYILLYVVCVVIVCLIQILNVAYLTLLERKILSAVQKRKGPNKVGLFGVLQPIADAFKLILKEINLPTRSETNLFFFGPLFML